MTTRNIVILSIVFVEILFLVYTSTFEFPTIDTAEMKNAVEVGLIQHEKELAFSKQLEVELREQQRLLSLPSISGEEMRAVFIKNILHPEDLQAANSGIEDGTITITAKNGSYNSFYWNTAYPYDPTNQFFDFNEEHEKEFIRNQKIKL